MQPVMSTKANAPSTLENLPLVLMPMIFLLLLMCSITPIKTGAIMPYKKVVNNKAFIGFIPASGIKSPMHIAIRIIK